MLLCWSQLNVVVTAQCIQDVGHRSVLVKLGGLRFNVSQVVLVVIQC